MINQIQEQEGQVHIQLEGDIDVPCAASMRVKLIPYAESGENIHFHFDFSAVRYIDSTGLGVLAAIHRRISLHGGTIKILQPHKPVKELFELTRLHHVFDIKTDASV